MSALVESPDAAYILLRLGEQRFAVRAENVEELAGSSHFQKFPQTTKQVEGVIVRRKRVMAVRDVASLLTGRPLPMHRFYLIVKQRYGAIEEAEAIPVTGDCELLSGVIPMPAEDGQPEYFQGLIDLAGERIPLLDLEKLAAATSRAVGGPEMPA